MKHFKINGLFAVAALCIVLCSCGTADKNALPVPKDAAFVMHINTKSLTSKLSWDDIKKTNWYSMQNGPGEQTMRQILENPDTTGIDTKEDLAFFVRRLRNKEGYFAFTGRLKNAAQFEAFNKKTASNAVSSKEGDVTIITLDDKTVAAYSGDKFIYLFDATTPSFDWPTTDTSFTMPVDSTGGVVDTTYTPPAPTPQSHADLKSHSGYLFKMKGDSMLIDDSRYASLIKKDGDVHLWMNAEASYNSEVLPMGYLSMLKLESYFKESVTTATLSFDNGKMVMHAKSYSNKEMTNLLKKYEGSDLNTDMLKRVPSDSLAFVLAVNYKPEGLKEFLKLGGLDGMVNSGLGEMGITLDDFVKANKGDLLIAVTDLKIKEYTVNLGPDVEKFTSKRPDVNILFATSVADKAAFDKLVALGNKLDPRMKSEANISYSLNNGWFAAGNNKPMVDQFIQGGNRNPAYISKISGHPIGAYVDLQNVLRVFATEPKDSVGHAQAAASLAMWQDIVMYGGEFKDGGIVQDIEVNLVDKNTNSLKQLSQYFDKMGSITPRGF